MALYRTPEGLDQGLADFVVSEASSVGDQASHQASSSQCPEEEFWHWEQQQHWQDQLDLDEAGSWDEPGASDLPEAKTGTPVFSEEELANHRLKQLIEQRRRAAKAKQSARLHDEMQSKRKAAADLSGPGWKNGYLWSRSNLWLPFHRGLGDPPNSAR